MPICVKPILDKTSKLSGEYLSPVTTSIDTCTDYILLTASEYTSLPTLTDIFAIPIAEDLQQMFTVGFSIPVVAYLTAWGYGVVINWFNEREH
jgi:hypothetical protein